ncbi:ATP/GTP-binding protein [Calditrichota bacterium]
MCGKTTNLQTIHGKVPEKLRGNLTSVATQQDRTLFFDLLPIEIGKIQGYSIRMQLYTVPGQVYYNASRKIVLKGVDGIVFVADSQAHKMRENIESLDNLFDNLKELNIDPEIVPTVLQYNKRDLSPLLTVEELNAELNKKGFAYFESIALTGHGVFDTLKGVTSLVVKNIREKLPKPEAPKPSTAQPTQAPKAATAASAPPPSLPPQAGASEPPLPDPQPAPPPVEPETSEPAKSAGGEGESAPSEDAQVKKSVFRKLPFRFKK